jgi:hypothetical protein
MPATANCSSCGRALLPINGPETVTIQDAVPRVPGKGISFHLDSTRGLQCSFCGAFTTVQKGFYEKGPDGTVRRRRTLDRIDRESLAFIEELKGLRLRSGTYRLVQTTGSLFDRLIPVPTEELQRVHDAAVVAKTENTPTAFQRFREEYKVYLPSEGTSLTDWLGLLIATLALLLQWRQGKRPEPAMTATDRDNMVKEVIQSLHADRTIQKIVDDLARRDRNKAKNKRRKAKKRR